LGGDVAYVFPAMLFVGGDIDHGAGAHVGDGAFDVDFELAGLDENHFFPFMVMRRVGHLARGELGYVEVDGVAFVGSAIEDLAGFVVGFWVDVYWEIFEVVGFGGELGFWLLGLREEGWQKDAEFSACVIHGWSD